MGNYPDWSIIIARLELLKDLVRFFKEYMPRYGYKHLCTEDDDYKYYQTPTSPASNAALWASTAIMEHR